MSHDDGAWKDEEDDDPRSDSKVEDEGKRSFVVSFFSYCSYSH